MRRALRVMVLSSGVLLSGAFLGGILWSGSGTASLLKGAESQIIGSDLKGDGGVNEPGSMLLAQAEGSKKAMTPKAEAKASEDNEDSPRLPNNYGKLELSGEQKDQVYAIQKKFEAEIESLEKQLAALKAKREAELLNVLTAAQKEKLKSIQATPKTKKAKTAETKPAT